MQTWIVIAAYNEEQKIASVLRDLKKHAYVNTVVVDDSSTDLTYEVAAHHTPHILQHVMNRGQGAALQTGIDYALSKGAKIIVTFDADGQHRAEDIPKLIEPIMKRAADVVLGSRFLQKNNTPFIRKILLKGGAWSMWFFYGVHLTDSHNGLRALSAKAARSMRISCDRMEHASEIIDEIARKRLSYTEVAVTIRYTDYSRAHASQSSLNAVRIFYTMMMKKLLK